MLNWLQGNKTYIGFLAAGCLGIAASMGWLSAEWIGVLGSIIGAWTGVGIAAKAARIEKKLDDTL